MRDRLGTTLMPEHYRRFFRLFIRMALIMLVVGGFAGVLYQELTKSIKYADIGPGQRIELSYRLAVLHGHSFLIGSVMPVCWLAILRFLRHLGAPDLTPRTLRWITWTYVPGAVSVLLLTLYKGVHYVQAWKGGERDFDAIHDGIFFGNKLVRGIAYGSSHTIATVGLCVFAVAAWRALSKAEMTES